MEKDDLDLWELCGKLEATSIFIDEQLDLLEFILLSVEEESKDVIKKLNFENAFCFADRYDRCFSHLLQTILNRLCELRKELAAGVGAVYDYERQFAEKETIDNSPHLG